MVKQIVVLVAVSIGITLSMAYLQPAIEFMLTAHDWVSQLLTEVFSVGQAGNIVRGLIALLSIPVIAGLVPALVYWMIKRHWFPYFMEVVWVVWFIQAGALLIMYKAAA